MPEPVTIANAALTSCCPREGIAGDYPRAVAADSRSRGGSVAPVAPGPAARVLIDKHTRLAGAAHAVLDHLDGTVVAVAAWVHEDERRRVRTELERIDFARLGEMTDRNLRLSAAGLKVEVVDPS